MNFKTITIVGVALLSFNIIFSQTHPDFEIINKVKTTAVKEQGLTGTCWAFATTSFIETEAIRMGKKEYDLSEMYFVYYAYLQKAQDYVMFHGHNNFAEGGQAHDVLNVIKEHGLLTEQAFLGKNYDLPFHKHDDLVKDLKAVAKNAATQEKIVFPTWYMAYKAVLDSYLGVPPVSFAENGISYNPKSFNTSEINFKPEDYIEFTSYTHHPFYEEFDLELPDNWSHDRYMNVPINDLMEIMDNALKNNFSICWDGDVSEDNFEKNNPGKAKLRAKDIKRIQDKGFQRYRQETFENFTTTDDHLMHIVGTTKDSEGRLYYVTKNSWGNYNGFGGYLYMSKDFVKLKGLALLVHKDAVPRAILKKCGL